MKKERKQRFWEKKLVSLQFLQDYRYNSILVKNFVIIFLLLICGFAGIMVLVSTKMNALIKEEVGMMSINSLGKTKERMDTVMKEVVQISGQLSLDNEVLLFLLPETDNLLSQNQTISVKKKIEMYSGVFDYIDSIYIYSNKSKKIVTNEGGGMISCFSDLTWFPNLTERENEPSRMISRLKEDRYPYLISYIQPVRLTQMQFLGGIIVNIDVGKLNKLVNSNLDDSKESLLIVDERNNVIFSSNQDHLMKKLTKLDFYKKLDFNKKTGYHIVSYEGQDFVVTTSPSDEFKWHYISTVPLSMYQEYKNGFKGFFFVLTLAILILSAVFAVIISLYSYIPVKDILNLLKNPDIYETGFIEESGLGKDETHEIALNIIRNLYSNKQMQDELGEYMTLINRAQLAALQAQISPHFLFNTLENIRWRAIDICHGDNEVSQIILNLSEMMRISLDNTQQVISIEEEIHNTRLYIEILQLRYEDKLKVEWELEPESLKYPIVKVSLQPLIENAVYHGIKPLRENGVIRIKVKKKGSYILIEVTDNGVGMTPAEIMKLNQDMREKYLLKDGHIGVRNVNQRLKLLLGDSAEVFVESLPERGTSVKIKLPSLTSSGEL